MHQNSLDSYRQVRETKGRCSKIVHSVIVKYKAITAKEIADKLGWGINCVTPRLCDLKKAGMIVEAGHVKNENGFNVTLYASVTEGGIV